MAAAQWALTGLVVGGPWEERCLTLARSKLLLCS